MADDTTPPTPLPPASQPPYPEQPAPHPQREAALEKLPAESHATPIEAPAIGALGVTLIGGAVAAAVGLLVAVPFLRRKAQPKSARPKSSKPAAKRGGRRAAPRKTAKDS